MKLEHYIIDGEKARQHPPCLPLEESRGPLILLAEDEVLEDVRDVFRGAGRELQIQTENGSILLMLRLVLHSSGYCLCECNIGELLVYCERRFFTLKAKQCGDILFKVTTKFWRNWMWC